MGVLAPVGVGFAVLYDAGWPVMCLVLDVLVVVLPAALSRHAGLAWLLLLARGSNCFSFSYFLVSLSNVELFLVPRHDDFEELVGFDLGYERHGEVQARDAAESSSRSWIILFLFSLIFSYSACSFSREA